jgi:hypothetical protein
MEFINTAIKNIFEDGSHIAISPGIYDAMH